MHQALANDQGPSHTLPAQHLRAQNLRAQAARCRRLAADVERDPAARVLVRMAENYEEEARLLEK